MPVTPLTYAVGYDTRQLEIWSNSVSESDEANLTDLQIKNCLQCVYTRENISDEQWVGFKMLLAKRGSRRPVEGSGLWGADIFRIPARDGLDFIRVKTRAAKDAAPT